MNLRTVALAVAMLSLSSVSFAQDRDQRPDRRDDRAEHRAPPPPARGVAHAEEHHDQRGGGPDHNFYRGGRLSTEYRSRQYVVDDWRGHHLSAPPRGYHWVQTGGDYVLAAVATGIIASVLLDH